MGIASLVTPEPTSLGNELKETRAGSRDTQNGVAAANRSPAFHIPSGRLLRVNFGSSPFVYVPLGDPSGWYRRLQRFVDIHQLLIVVSLRVSLTLRVPVLPPRPLELLRVLR